MNIRNYNIYFNTHTISGIVICALLYVIFFAGSFSFFKHEIQAWQHGVSYEANKEVGKDFDFLLDSLRQTHNLQGRDITFYLQPHSLGASVNMSVSKDTTVSKPKQAPAEGQRRGRRGGGDASFFYYDFHQEKASTYAESYDMGEFLYRLHFLAQLNQVPIRIGMPFGYTIAGLVSFLFLFALITGLLLHWDKIVSNFFIFRPWSKWKTVWTDMHTALGVIGFPFQFIFALTGIILIVNWVLVKPLTNYLYDGKQEELYLDLGFSDSQTYEYLYQPIDQDFNTQPYLAELKQKWNGAEFSRVFLKNYGDESMHLIVHAKPNPKLNFSGEGKAVYRIHDQQLIYEKDPHSTSSYKDKVSSIIYHLHFGDFGGYPVKITFFILGIMGCIVIISGILIWLVARDKNNIPKHKRVFNFWASNIFLAICLTMLPVTAFTFIAVKVYPEVNQDFIYSVYFYSWLALSIFYVIRRDLRATNKETLLVGALLGFCIPVVNGLYGGNWIWKTFAAGETDILFFDLLWIAISVVALLAFVKIQRDGVKENNSEKEPAKKPSVVPRRTGRLTKKPVSE
ncbi:PepSY domain-containing protein [Sphingobacterium sp. DN00404]|uniref:PepSY domain-containing protein n=1 Tax=Sphingobacterium micropteri TaxID=2763501 RepID=A0ABR7YKD1_9SPHI|nr:PepSY-associated TM helix domain-containing protein [Sphingobacterium micropteri]MBD1431792.1 PepSY domain-containing protein [Sphingobacterium micropteri]